MTAAPTTQATKIVVQETLDETAFYAVDGVKYESVSIEDEGDGFATRVVFVVFTPSNGYDKGKVHRIPFSRVISIIGDEG